MKKTLLHITLLLFTVSMVSQTSNTGVLTVSEGTVFSTVKTF
ncbi:hypothetical protein QWY92_07905 [Algibacter miyuki]|nr:hypothetical protein [Algibacter miyuki]MDN3665333.1 hypothetical protein [Algibacter miyuki]